MEANMPKGAEPAYRLEEERVAQVGEEQLVLDPGEYRVAIVLIRPVVVGAEPGRVEDLEAGSASLESEVHFLHAISVWEGDVTGER
jgi:hypothetical protein